MAVLAQRAGIPVGVFSVVATSNSQNFGQKICSNEKVRKMTFTRSTQVRRLVAE
ncbi:MAG: aldehyde dehydrogenase family protein [Pseudomonadota bacterium]|nr:aldehyde dehydrogenase family protein [Pseudomonadota bacterium]